MSGESNVSPMETTAELAAFEAFYQVLQLAPSQPGVAQSFRSLQVGKETLEKRLDHEKREREKLSGELTNKLQTEGRIMELYNASADAEKKLQAQNLNLSEQVKEAEKRILELEAEMRPLKIAADMREELIRDNVEGALCIVEANHATTCKDLRDKIYRLEHLLQVKTSEFDKLSSEFEARDLSVQTLRSQFEENMARLSQRKSTNTEKALLRRIAELEEQLESRDRDSAPRKKTKTKKSTNQAASKTHVSPARRSLTKKFVFDN